MKFLSAILLDIEGPMPYVILATLLLFIVIIITRLIFSIPTIVANLKSQTTELKVMSEIMTQTALKNGFTQQEISKIEESAKRQAQEI